MTNNASAYTLIYLGAHLSGKQMVFVFSYEGSVPNSVLKSASAVGIGGNSDGGVTLHCVRQEEKKQIRCTVGKALHYNYIHLYLGYTSVGWVPVPEYRPAESQNCPYFFFSGQYYSWDDTSQVYQGSKENFITTLELYFFPEQYDLCVTSIPIDLP